MDFAQVEFESKETNCTSDEFYINFLAKRQVLNRRNYHNLDELKQAVFALYAKYKIDRNNTVLTYLDPETKSELLLTKLPDPKSGEERAQVFIHTAHPLCAMCLNSFGILDNQQLFQCSIPDCGEQYCGNCVKSIRGSSEELPFICVSCRKESKPQRNMIIEKYIIWPRMSHEYGTESLPGLKKQLSGFSAVPIIQDIDLRRIHLKARLTSFQNKLPMDLLEQSSTLSLIDDVTRLCSQCEILAAELRTINIMMRKRGTLVSHVVDEYKKELKTFDTLCERLTSNTDQLRTNGNDSKSMSSTSTRESNDDIYAMKQLASLPSDQSIATIELILQDIDFRRATLSSRIGILATSSQTSTRQNEQVNKALEKAKGKLKKIDQYAEELNCLRNNLRAVERWTDQYLDELSDDRQPEIPGSRFIYLLEMLRFETERLETAEYFPHTTQLIQVWQSSFDTSTEGEFKPKIIELCQSIESDIKRLFSEFRSIYTVPYRIGVIGQTSVGKSALIMRLANLTEYSAMVNLERSTFGYLQFDAGFPSPDSDDKTVPVSFVDIAGSTDDQTSRSIGNYLDLIMNADCDVYIMVFDKPFDHENQNRFDFIEKTLGRKCLLVRSKVDLIFDEFYRQETGSKFQELKEDDYSIASVLQMTENFCQKTYDEKRIKEKVFMTAAGADNQLKRFHFGEFSMNDLKKEICRLACRDMRIERVSQLAMLAVRKAINTCFRRNYTLCQTKYQWLAAAASIVPFLDEIPSFLGMEQIRQAFGVHERSTITNKVFRTKNSLEDYLEQRQLVLPDGLLKSDCFSYLVAPIENAKPSNDTQALPISQDTICSIPKQQEDNSIKGKILGQALAGLGVLGKVFDDAIRLAAPAASGIFRTASIAGIVIGAGLAPVFAAWTFYSSGKRMNEHVHVLCDDFQVLLTFFILHTSNQYRTMTLKSPLTSDDESFSTSSDDSDDD